MSHFTKTQTSKRDSSRMICKLCLSVPAVASGGNAEFVSQITREVLSYGKLECGQQKLCVEVNGLIFHGDLNYNASIDFSGMESAEGERVGGTDGMYA
jgi:hypothetical protein